MLASLVFDSPLLARVHEAVERRGKAIRYHASVECTREVEHGVERLNVDLRSTDQIQFRFSLWQDGRFWLTVNKPGPSRTGGWQINQQVEGDIGRWTPSEIVERIEATMMTPTDVSRVWHTNASNQA